MTPNIKAIVADEMKGYMIQNNAAIGVTFSGKPARCWKRNPNPKYVVPTEASNLWFDNMVIPKTVKNQDAAYAFINFMLKPENALKMQSMSVTQHQTYQQRKCSQRRLVRTNPSIQTLIL